MKPTDSRMRATPNDANHTAIPIRLYPIPAPLDTTKHMHIRTSKHKLTFMHKIQAECLSLFHEIYV